MIVAKQSVSRKDVTTIFSHCTRAKRKASVAGRQYTTGSKRLQAATALASTSQKFDTTLFSQFVGSPQRADSAHVQVLLKHRFPFTLIPPPLPEGYTSPLNDIYFPTSQVQDSLAVIDACLHNCHDVNRAKVIFDDLRAGQRTENILDVSLYNQFLEAFIQMAFEKDVKNRERWVDETWDLYATIESGQENVQANTKTYALALLTMVRFSSSPDGRSTSPLSGTDLLTNILINGMSFSDVIFDPVFTEAVETATAVKLLQVAAVSLGRSDLATQLFALTSDVPMEEIADDPLDAFPELKMVTKPRPEFMGYRTRPKKAKLPPSEDSNDPAELLAATASESTSDSTPRTPFNLQTLRNNIERLLAARRALPEDVSSRQRLLEESAYDDAAVRLQHEYATKHADTMAATRLAQPTLQNWMWSWYAALTERLEVDIRRIVEDERNRTRDVAQTLAPFITLVKPRKLAVITILELMRLHGSGDIAEGMKTARALIAVGHGVEVEYQAEDLKRREKSSRFPYPTQSEEAEQGKDLEHGLSQLAERRKLFKSNVSRISEWAPEWTTAVKLKVGSFLVETLMDVAKVTRTTTHPKTGLPYSEEQPAFLHSYEYRRGKKLGVIKLNPVIAERLTQDSLDRTLHPRHLPMLVQPRPWLTYKEGGYLYNKNCVMRIKDSSEQLTYLSKASSEGHLELVFSGLDVLGSTPWQINKDVFKIALEIWNSGEELGHIPPATVSLEEPEKPANFDTDQRVKLVYLVKLQDVLNARRNNHSDRCSVNYKMEIARAFLGERFYMPHNVDFRGRAYPIPPHLNHIGDDLSRGLLMFGESKPLGQNGLRWLKIHLANLYGFDKASFDEREAFSMEHLDDIFDSAEKPLEGRRWWTKADDPYQCLAACIELRKALEFPDPYAYESALPIHQDGTCNGLQHYAALGGDAVGARQVNLDITDRPSDVYTYVANMVEDSIEQDRKNGNKMAELLSKKISRKIVKQTVMTTVYGVTFVGARAQIERQLKDKYDWGRLECWDASHYLAHQTLDCIGNLFSGAKHIQLWLSDSARLIAKSMPETRVQHARGLDRKGKRRMTNELMTSVIWTTPIGLPIVQPYRRLKRKQVATALQSVYLSNPNAPSQVNPTKQASAFPPNFIHSLDATHMMLTALECRRAGLIFASVHDSYWTHASSVDKMSEIIRETFIHLHSSDVLTRLRNEFLERYADHVIPVDALTDKQIQRINAETDLDLPRKKAAKRELTAKSAEPENSETEEEEEEEIAIGTRSKETKFVKFADVAPKLPEKGEFSVQTIKDSLYFFS